MQKPEYRLNQEERLQARMQKNCFVCGQDNERGLRIPFTAGPDGAISARWCPEPDFEGFRGIVHGGVVSTVLDEAMSKAVAATATQALTAELRVRFRKHVEAGSRYVVRGWIVKQSKRLMETEAVLIASDGSEHAHAWARFLALARTHS